MEMYDIANILVATSVLIVSLNLYFVRTEQENIKKELKNVKHREKMYSIVNK